MIIFVPTEMYGREGIARLEKEVGTTQNIIPVLCVFQYKDRLGIRMAPAAASTAMYSVQQRTRVFRN